MLSITLGGQVLATGHPKTVAGVMPDPPPLLELGRRLGWPRVCLDLREARALAPVLRRVEPRHWRGSPAWAARHLTLLHSRQPVLEDVSLEGGAGEVVVLMGANGSGKTTLLRALAGLQAAVSGAVERPPGRIAYPPPGPWRAPPPAFGEGRGRPSPCDTARGEQPAAMILAEMGLLDVADRYPRDLSSGQRQGRRPRRSWRDHRRWPCWTSPPGAWTRRLVVP